MRLYSNAARFGGGWVRGDSDAPVDPCGGAGAGLAGAPGRFGRRAPVREISRAPPRRRGRRDASWRLPRRGGPARSETGVDRRTGTATGPRGRCV